MEFTRDVQSRRDLPRIPDYPEADKWASETHWRDCRDL